MYGFKYSYVTNTLFDIYVFVLSGLIVSLTYILFHVYKVC
ncbi:hypothetical protein AB205_0025250 [Aquarana catesbeiana]|uniref:Uncharacterized protein n=1 Tax=Aquarana catesbeiana TaxID=8400 RepID=A0A2G9SB86_AQUCT|nr:hypothetical protein AB205_0025250 [Aquarana catesbeiana]